MLGRDIFWKKGAPKEDAQRAHQYLEFCAEAYRQIERPATRYFDWRHAASRTLQSMSRSRACKRILSNRVYFNAYVGSDYKPPEAMVHLALLQGLIRFQELRRQKLPLADAMLQSLYSFFDEAGGFLHRWLPGIPFKKEELSEEEDTGLIDSWYQLHVLYNLARIADTGHSEGRALFLKSLDHIIRAAHRFEYEWPVFYKTSSFEVVKSETQPGQGGEHDVPGLYTYVMMEAYEWTREKRYLEEAETSARHMRTKGFSLLYQTNNMMIGANALLRLWQATAKLEYLELSKLGIANCVAKMWLREVKLGKAAKQSTFMGAVPLHDCKYLAAFEEAEIFESAYEYLDLAKDALSPQIELLLTEYMKYLLHRGRYYFPAELPPEAICQTPREGEIKPNLWIPLEDLYAGEMEAGQVGQEVYGSALSFALCYTAYLRRPELPFYLFCEYPLRQADLKTENGKGGQLHFSCYGAPDFSCKMRILPLSKDLPGIKLVTSDPERSNPKAVSKEDGSIEYQLWGRVSYLLDWTNS